MTLDINCPICGTEAGGVCLGDFPAHCPADPVSAPKPEPTTPAPEPAAGRVWPPVERAEFMRRLNDACTMPTLLEAIEDWGPNRDNGEATWCIAWDMAEAGYPPTHWQPLPTPPKAGASSE